MSRGLSLLFVGSLALALGGCAGIDGNPSILMETSRAMPPPLPVAAPVKPLKAKAVPKREVAPLPSSRPTVPAPTVKETPPHKWYDHLKFWKN